MPMQRLELLLLDLKNKTLKNKVICTIWPLAMQRRNVYPSSSSKTNQPLELLHIDIWRPFRYLTRMNCKMFITISDDYSRMCWIFLVRKKSEFPKICMNFVNVVENQFSLKVKTVRIDNAMELTKGEEFNFYLAHGIKQQSSCTDTPQ